MASRLTTSLVALTTLALAQMLAPRQATAAEAVMTNAPAAPKTALKIDEVTASLKDPWGLQFLPDGRMLVTERGGQMRLVTPAGKVSEPIAGLPHVVAKGQGGLLDVLVAPDFAASGTIFFSYAESRGGFSNGTSVVRCKLILDGEGGRIEDGEVIFRQEPAARGFYHFGSRLVLDAKGALFVTLGERSDLREGAQDLETHLGKVVRINADGSSPPDNPYAKSEKDRPEIWS